MPCIDNWVTYFLLESYRKAAVVWAFLLFNKVSEPDNVLESYKEIHSTSKYIRELILSRYSITVQLWGS